MKKKSINYITIYINIYINIYSDFFRDFLAKVRAQKMTAVICHNCHFFSAPTLFHLILLRFQGCGDDVSHAGGTLVVGVDAVVNHLVTVVSEEGMQVDDL